MQTREKNPVGARKPHQIACSGERMMLISMTIIRTPRPLFARTSTLREAKKPKRQPRETSPQ